MVKLDHIGDFALALPALRGLKNLMPETVIDVVVSPVNRGWREVVPWLGQVETIQFPAYQTGRERKRGKRQLIAEAVALAWRLRKGRYATTVDLRMMEGDWRGKLLGWLSGAPRRLGGSGAGERMLTEICEEKAVHQAERIAERLRRIAPGLEATLEGCVSIRRSVAVSKIRRVLLHPGAGSAAKKWIAEYWVRLARLLTATPTAYEVHILGAAGDEALIRQICAEAGLDPGSQTISRSLRETLQQMADSEAIIGLDSAAPHLAALVGTPAITIFSGAAPWEQWKALGANTVLSHEIECRPCLSGECRWPTHRCMEAITPEMVLAALRAIKH